MRVLVTGGAGFIGSHVVDVLVSAGAQVAVLDDLSTGRFENLNPGANFYRGSIEGAELVELIERERPAVVFHQAAQVDVQRSLREPLADVKTNISGTLNLLEVCRRFGVKKVVYASSAAVYGNPSYLPVDEKHPVEPLSCYGISKYVPELYLETYRHLYGLNYTVLRYANVYGPRQDVQGEGGVVAVFTWKLLRGESPCIFGDGEQTRDFIYVKDVAAANLAAIDGGNGMVLNISTGAPVSVNTLFAGLKEITGSPLGAVYGPPRPGDITHSYLSAERAGAAVGWSPRYSLAEGLRETVAHYAEKSSMPPCGAGRG
ncbi:MAG: SDR family oxidoreductase [Peptococcaceae bacterium]|jgi:UDP-glucose 4-epimerase|nr:MAG: SDR family oxidoreductase [Peptococcaceae bacterium]